MRVPSRIALALALAFGLGGAGCSSDASAPTITGSVKGLATLGSARTGNRGIVVGVQGGRAAVTDDEGNYQIDNLPIGAVTILAEAPGYAIGTSSATVVAGMTATAAPIALVASGGTTDAGSADAPAPTGRIEGTATLGSAQTGNTGIVVGIAGGAIAITDDAGHFAFDHVAPGDVTLEAEFAGYAPATARVTVVAGQTAMATGLQLVAVKQPPPTTGTIRGVATLAGKSKGNGGIVVGISGGPAVTTDDAGRYTIAGVAPGTVTLQAQYPGYLAGTTMVTVAAAMTAMPQQIDLATVPAPAPTTGTVTGQATLGSQTKGNAGIIVAVGGGGAVATDDAGNYTITGVGAGAATVTAQYPGYTSGQASVTVNAGQSVMASKIVLAPAVAPTPPKLTITAVTPARASTAGNDALTISGTGFDGNTIFTIGGAAVRATNVTATGATLATPAGQPWGVPVAIAATRSTDGATATNSNANGSPSAFSFYASRLLFSELVRLNQNFYAAPRVALTGDFNNDGLNDLIGTYFSSSIFSTYLNTGGNFAYTWNDGTAAGLGVQKGQALDLDGDGNLDYLVADESGTWEYNLGNGTGRMVVRGQQFYQVCSGENSPVGLHLSSSTLYDVAIVCEGNNQVRVWMNEGANNPGNLYGGRNAAAQLTLATGATPSHIVVTDLNQDGKDDLVVVNLGSGAPTLGWYLQAAGSLPTTATGTAGTNGATQNPYWGACGDLNGDKFPDCVVSDTNTNTVRVFLNDGKGALLAPASGGAGTIPVGQDPREVNLVDMNGDGNLDLVVASRQLANVQVIPGRGDGTLGTVTAQDGHALVSSAVVGSADCRFGWTAKGIDMDGDGAKDLVMTCEQNDRGEPNFGGHLVFRNVSR